MPDGRLKRNTRQGKWLESVRRLGRVAPCVRDDFAWLPGSADSVKSNEKGMPAHLVLGQLPPAKAEGLYCR